MCASHTHTLTFPSPSRHYYYHYHYCRCSPNVYAPRRAHTIRNASVTRHRFDTACPWLCGIWCARDPQNIRYFMLFLNTKMCVHGSGGAQPTHTCRLCGEPKISSEMRYFDIIKHYYCSKLGLKLVSQSSWHVPRCALCIWAKCTSESNKHIIPHLRGVYPGLGHIHVDVFEFE